MQIREITIQEGLGWELTKGIGRAARDQFIQSATGVSNPYQKTDMTGYVDPDATDKPVASATTPSSSRVAGAKARAASAARKGTPAVAVNPSSTPVVYRFDGRALDPRIPGDAGIIKTLQAAGVTSATST
jgi:hypothetical protein